MTSSDPAWTSQDLAKHLCDDLVASKALKEKPTFIRTDREELLAGLFAKMGLDGQKMASFENAGPLETLVRNSTEGQAWVDSVIGGLKAMLPQEVASAKITIGMSEEAKEELAAAKEKTAKMRDRQESGKGGGRRRDDEDNTYGNFGGRSGGYGRSGGGDQECFNCGGLGHMSRDCDAPRKPKGGGKSGRGGGGEECFNCGEVGHMSRDCDQPRKPKAGGRGDRDD